MTKARTLADFNATSIDPALLDDTGTIPSALLAGVGGGVTEADQWRLTADKAGQQEPLSADLSRVNSDGFALLGTGMSQSSGVFTFPSTGHYLVMANVTFEKDGAQRRVGVEIQSSVDGSNFNSASEGFTHVSDESNGSQSFTFAQASFLFDVIDTSTHKVRFNINTNNDGNVNISASTSTNKTCFTFIKLADT